MPGSVCKARLQNLKIPCAVLLRQIPTAIQYRSAWCSESKTQEACTWEFPRIGPCPPSAPPQEDPCRGTEFLECFLRCTSLREARQGLGKRFDRHRRRWRRFGRLHQRRVVIQHHGGQGRKGGIQGLYKCVEGPPKVGALRDLRIWRYRGREQEIRGKTLGSSFLKSMVAKATKDS